MYLDPSREWQPEAGAAGYLNRLWGWFDDAVAGRFDANTALYQAVGGVSLASSENPTVVVRDELPDGHGLAWLSPTTTKRYDLRAAKAADADLATPLWTARDFLPFGASSSLAELIALLDDPRLERGGSPEAGAESIGKGLLHVLATAATRNPMGTTQPFVLQVPHPTGPTTHVLVGAIRATNADQIRNRKDIPRDIEIDWWFTSDERASITTRRDSARPTQRYVDKSILLVGVGGIGSWIAEFILRAGAARLAVADPGAVLGGHLVRQNYEDEDIGDVKADAIARRLSAIRPEAQVEVVELPGLPDPGTYDLIIDASVHHAVSLVLDVYAAGTELAQIATDPRTGTLGLVLVRARTDTRSVADIDLEIGEAVKGTPKLEAFTEFWSGSAGQGVVPTLGCSIPTFHGSAADMAGVAAAATSLLAGHLVDPVSGGHLFALPHSMQLDVGHVFIPSADASAHAQGSAASE